MRPIGSPGPGSCAAIGRIFTAPVEPGDVTTRDAPVILFVDDGHPEARDYDDNYVCLDPVQRPGLLTTLLRRWRGSGARAPGSGQVVAVAPCTSVALGG